jgi:hypothetical protein
MDYRGAKIMATMAQAQAASDAKRSNNNSTSSSPLFTIVSGSGSSSNPPAPYANNAAGQAAYQATQTTPKYTIVSGGGSSSSNPPAPYANNAAGREAYAATQNTPVKTKAYQVVSTGSFNTPEGINKAEKVNEPFDFMNPFGIKSREEQFGVVSMLTPLPEGALMGGTRFVKTSAGAVIPVLERTGASIYKDSIVRSAGQVASRAGTFAAENIIPRVGGAITTPAGKFVTGVGIGVVTSQVAPPAAKGAFDILAPSELTKEEQIAVSQEARKRTEERIGSEGLNIPFVDAKTETLTANMIGSSIYSLPGGTLAVAPKYGQETEKILIEKGYSESRAKLIAERETQREVFAGGTGEFAGLVVSAGTVGELVGRAGARTVGGFLGGNTIKVLGNKTGTAAATIAGAAGGVVGGAVEGALMYPSQQGARYKNIDVGDWAFTTGISGATAGLAGGVIGGLSVAAPKAGKFLYNVLGVGEGGQEFVGDYGAGKVVGEAFDLKFNIGGKPTKVNVSTSTSISNVFPGLSSSSSSTMMSTPVPTPGITPTTGFTPEIVGFTPTPTPNPTVTPSRGTTLPTPEIVPSVEPSTETPTPTPTYTFTQTPTTAFTPTFTGKFMPFIPPIAGGGEFGAKNPRRERTRFIDEFSAAFAGLARPSEGTYFGKQKPIALARRMYGKKKGKRKRGGVNYASIFA